MKVGIITYHSVPNYGAAMQAWGLQKFLQSLGYDVFIIDYRPAHLTTGGAFWWPTNSWRCRANLVILYQKLMSLRHTLFGNAGKVAKFASFHNNFLCISGPLYNSLAELQKNPPAADVYVCGSDQIWNASKQFGIDPAYFLDFGSSETKRVAYAASFGRAVVSQRFYNATAILLSRLDAISVREASGVDLIHDLVEREASLLPDPTLLVEDGFPEAELPQKNQPEYLFSYTLRSREGIGTIEKNIAQRKGLTIISPETMRTSKIGNLTPLQWLGYIKKSSFIVTNSYHGTLFSIIFHRPFVFVGLVGQNAEYNERAISLLKRLGLMTHVVYGFDRQQVDAIADAVPEWERIHREIAIWRDEARSFLQEAIDDR